jgi:uncharacterized membrane protein
MFMRTSAGRENPTLKNVTRIAKLELEMLHQRTFADRVGDAITHFAGSGTFVIIHAVWFVAWIVINLGNSGIRPFDPFPFSLLTMVVSLEAIFLAIFVLISQNHMSHMADRRAHLDLQVDLLAEQEMTAVLRTLEKLCDKMDVKLERQTKELEEEMDPHRLLEELRKRLPDY